MWDPNPSPLNEKTTTLLEIVSTTQVSTIVFAESIVLAFLSLWLLHGTDPTYFGSSQIFSLSHIWGSELIGTVQERCLVTVVTYCLLISLLRGAKRWRRRGFEGWLEFIPEHLLGYGNVLQCPLYDMSSELKGHYLKGSMTMQHYSNVQDLPWSLVHKSLMNYKGRGKHQLRLI